MRLRAIVLLLSLVGNLLIARRLLARGPGDAPAPEGDAPATAARAGDRLARTIAAVPRLGDPACQQLAELQREQERIQSGLRQVESAHHQYQATSATAPELERALREAVSLPATAVSCKTSVCRVEVLGDGGVDMRLVNAIEENDWVSHHLRGVSLNREGLFLAMRDEDEAYGADVLLHLVSELYASGTIERCSAAAGPPAEVAARLRLVPMNDLQSAGDRTAVVVELHGAGAESAFGRCLYVGLASLTGSSDLPERVSSALFEDVGLWPPAKQERYRRLSQGK